MQRCHNPWLQPCNILWSVPTNTRPEKLTASHGYIPLPHGPHGQAFIWHTTQAERWGRPPETQRPLIPQDHHPRHNSDTRLANVMQWHATSTSVVTSVSKIRLWQNGVTDDEW